jgi:hypothetical protein
VTTPEQAVHAADIYHQLLDSIQSRQLHANVSVKLTQMGLDIDPDLRPIWHRVDIDTAVQRADVQRGCAHHLMSRDVEIKRLKPGDGAVTPR